MSDMSASLVEPVDQIGRVIKELKEEGLLTQLTLGGNGVDSKGPEYKRRHVGSLLISRRWDKNVFRD